MKFQCVLIASAGAALTIAAAGPASADAARDQTFKACDGYEGPSATADAITQQARMLGLRTYPEYTVRAEIIVGSGGVAACDQALADPLVQTDAKWMRKVSLIRAKAIHELAIKDIPAAMRDLDLAEAAAKAPNETLYARSLGLGIVLTRALAVRMAGDQAKAEDIAMGAWAKRPFDEQIIRSALIAIGPGADPAKIDKLSIAMASLQPEAAEIVFAFAIDNGRWAEAVNVYPQLTPAENHDIGQFYSWQQRKQSLDNRYTREKFWAVNAGAYAYALAALGRADEARATLKKARARLDEALIPPPEKPVPPNGKPKADPERNQALAWIRELQRDAEPQLKTWSQFAEYRAGVADGRAAQVALQMSTGGRIDIPSKSSAIELCAAIVAALTADKTPIPPSFANCKAEINKLQNPREVDRSVMHLFAALPDAEGPERIAGYKKSPLLSIDWDGTGYDGFRTRQVSEAATSVNFLDSTGSASIVEEMSLLRAAEAAKAAGKKGFIVRSSINYQRFETQTYMGMAGPKQPNGYQCERVVSFVDPDHLPPEFEQSAWRVLDADAVWNALAPVYVSGAR